MGELNLFVVAMYGVLIPYGIIRWAFTGEGFNYRQPPGHERMPLSAFR